MWSYLKLSRTSTWAYDSFIIFLDGHKMFISGLIWPDSKLINLFRLTTSLPDFRCSFVREEPHQKDQEPRCNESNDFI
jgi:hypothetical protein